MKTGFGRLALNCVRGGLLAGAAALMLAVPQQLAAKELKLASFLPPQHPIVKLYNAFAEDIAKETNGDLTIKVFPAGALGAGPFQQYKRAIEGVADITDVCHAFHGKVFAKTLLIVQAGKATSAADATERLWRINDEYLGSDYKHVRNIFMYTVPQAVLVSREKKVRGLDDFKGVKVFSPGATFVPILASWGMTPVPMKLQDMYSAMSTGVVDMVALPATSMTPPFRLSELASSVSVGLTGLLNPCGMIMNKASYAALSDSQKAALDKLSGKTLSMKAAKIFDGWSGKAMKLAAESDKIEVIRFSDDVKDALYQSASKVADKVIADMEAAGIADARATYDALNR